MTLNHQNGPTWEAVLSYGTPKTVFVGIDEVGRGAWAGPVVAAAVILPYGLLLPCVNDSKKLTANARAQLDISIRANAEAIGVGWVEPAEVDAKGLSWAVRTSGERALNSLGTMYDLILLDGSHNYLAPTHNSVSLVRGDAILVPVAAASIVAKVARDTYMEQLSETMPEFSFAKHKGYGTAAHQAELLRHGPSKYHRLSYKPVGGAG